MGEVVFTDPLLSMEKLELVSFGLKEKVNVSWGSGSVACKCPARVPAGAFSVIVKLLVTGGTTGGELVIPESSAMVMDFVIDGAAAKVPSPAWVAVTKTVPLLSRLRMFPATVPTVGSSIEKTTGRPEVAWADKW